MALAGDHIVVKMDNSGGTLQTFPNGDIISVDIPYASDQHDVTGFGDSTHKVINGQLRAPVTIKGYVTTTASVGTHTVIRDVFQQSKQASLEVQVGNNAAPTTGDPKFSGEYYVSSYTINLNTGGAVMFTAVLNPAVGIGTGVPAWGVV
jgi:hypothetical protein